MPSLRFAVASVVLATAACASAPPPREPAAPAPAPAAAKEPEAAKPVDPRVALANACAADEPDHDACATLASMLVDDPASDPRDVLGAADGGCAPANELRPARGEACRIIGDALRDGKVVARDARNAERAYTIGCLLGDDASCKAKRDLADAERAASGVPGANITIDSITADGATVQKIACKTEGGGLGGLFGSLVLAKPFADKKAALDACAKTPHATRVRWTAKGGKMSDVHVISGDDPSNRCVEKVLTGAIAAVSGTCAASVDIGKAKRANGTK